MRPELTLIRVNYHSIVPVLISSAGLILYYGTACWPVTRLFGEQSVIDPELGSHIDTQWKLY